MESKNPKPEASRPRSGLLASLITILTLLAFVLAGCGAPRTNSRSNAALAQVLPLPGSREPASPSPEAGGAAAPVPPEVSHDTDPIQVLGSIDNLPADGLHGAWQISGLTVQVLPDTNVDQQLGAAAPGAEVEVQGWLQLDGSLQAGWIRVLGTVHSAASAGPLPLRFIVSPAAQAQDHDPVPPVSQPVEAPAGGPEGAAQAAVPAEFAGSLEQGEASQANAWRIDGRDVMLNSSTTIVGLTSAADLISGVAGRVFGWLQPDGTVHAARIVTTPEPTPVTTFEWLGPLQQLPRAGLSGVWIVGGQKVIVDSSTQFVGDRHDLRIGGDVRIRGRLADDGSMHAQEITVPSAPALALAAPAPGAVASDASRASSPSAANQGPAQGPVGQSAPAQPAPPTVQPTPPPSPQPTAPPQGPAPQPQQPPAAPPPVVAAPQPPAGQPGKDDKKDAKDQTKGKDQGGNKGKDKAKDKGDH